MAPTAHAAGDDPPKTLRYAFRVAETGFDPARISDLYSRICTAHMFEALYQYDHLARPAKVKPLTALALPEASADFRRFTIRIRPGIFFADDPAFGGQKRELVADDYVYSLKRFADPASKSPAWGEVAEIGYSGLAALRQRALETRTPFDYDTPIDGLQAVDRHTLVITTDEPRPRLVEYLADNGLYGAVAREVVQFYGDKIAEHPVGTGAFRLARWRRSSEMVFDRNPGYRHRVYEDDAEPNADDAEGQALLAKFRGRRLPLLDRVIVAIIEEPQPRWLSFLNRQQDFIERVPEEFANVALPGGKVAPNLAKLGISAWRTVGAEGVLTVYNMDDPVVGGYTPAKIALRRALNLAVDVQREINLARRGQAIPAQSPSVPHTTGYDPGYRSEMGEYSPAKARALLDMHGYVDRDGDGSRQRRAPVRRAVAEEHGGHRHQGRVQVRQVAREPEGDAGRQGADLARGLVGQPARRPGCVRAAVRPVHRRGQPVALSPAGLRRGLQPPVGPAQRARARRAVQGGQAPVGGVCAVQAACAPFLQRHGPPLAAGLPAGDVRQPLVAHGRHRRRPARQGLNQLT